MHDSVREPPGRRPAALAVGLALCAGACSIDTNFSPIHPVASVSPESLDFGEVVANEEPRIQELYVTNSGPVPLEVSGITVEGAGFSVLSPTVFEVPEDETVTVEVQFAPTEVAEYDDGLLTLGTNDIENAAIRVPLTGVGRVPYAPDIEITPSILVWEGVRAGSSELKAVDITNVGDADLEIEGTTPSGAGAFRIETPLQGVKVPPGESTLLWVQYTARDVGDSGSIEIAHNDTDETPTRVGLEGNGGGDSDDYPVAVIDCPGEVGLAGPQDLLLDGSQSYDPLGGGLTYDWALALRPTGGDPQNALVVDPVDPTLASLLLDAAGVWEVALTVTSDVSGLSSVPAVCRIDAVPEDRIHVELSWAGSTSDMDLHLARDLGEFYATPGDVSWCNANPDWGTAGLADDDPRLDADDDEGYGPENINVFEPADSEGYQVRVHLFDDGDDGETTATVVVFLDGAEAWSGSKLLERNEVWDVGRILWPEAVFSPDNDQPWDAEGVRECR